MSKVLILVLSALRHPWGSLMYKQMETWDSIENPNTSTLYYVGSTSGDFLPRVVYSSFDEALYNMGRRTLQALEESLKIPGWEHLARVHSSCYVNKAPLNRFTEALPKTGVFCGLRASLPCGRPYLWGGGHFILSRDVVAAVVENKRFWDHNQMEDVALSDLVTILGISFTDGKSCSVNPELSGGWSCVAYNGEQGGFHFSDFSEINKLDQHFFRVKHDADRSVDLQTMNLLFKHLKHD